MEVFLLDCSKMTGFILLLVPTSCSSTLNFYAKIKNFYNQWVMLRCLYSEGKMMGKK